MLHDCYFKEKKYKSMEGKQGQIKCLATGISRMTSDFVLDANPTAEALKHSELDEQIRRIWEEKDVISLVSSHGESID